jgi:hypothetical protein
VVITGLEKQMLINLSEKNMFLKHLPGFMAVRASWATLSQEFVSRPLPEQCSKQQT